MDPITASKALRLIARKIDISHNPSISDITSELENVLQYISGETQTAGPTEWVKDLKRKVLNTKDEKKILDRIDYLNFLMKLCEPISRMIRSGEDMVDIISDEDYLEVLEKAAKFIVGGSEMLNSVNSRNVNVKSALTNLDKYWFENENEEEKDREAIVNSLSELHSKCEDRIQKNQKRLLLIQNNRSHPGFAERGFGNNDSFSVKRSNDKNYDIPALLISSHQTS